MAEDRHPMSKLVKKIISDVKSKGSSYVEVEHLGTSTGTNDTSVRLLYKVGLTEAKDSMPIEHEDYTTAQGSGVSIDLAMSLLASYFKNKRYEMEGQEDKGIIRIYEEEQRATPTLGYDHVFMQNSLKHLPGITPEILKEQEIDRGVTREFLIDTGY